MWILKCVPVSLLSNERWILEAHLSSFICLIIGWKRYSLWILLLQHQSQHEWCVRSLRVGISQDVPSLSSCLLKEIDKNLLTSSFITSIFFLYTQETSKPCDPMCCWAWRRHVEKDTHSCLPRGRWNAGGPSCFSLQEPLEVVWMRDSLMKSLGNYCSFSRGGLVVSLQYQHYQTSLVALTMPWEREKERGVGAQCEKVYV